MELDDYQREASRTDKSPAEPERGLVFPMVGLASEVGALIGQYKKFVRDGDAHDFFSDRVAEELGDCMWYIASLAGKLDLTLEEIAQLNLKRTQERWPLPGEETPVRMLDDDAPESERLPREVSVSFEEVCEGESVFVRLTSDGRSLGDPLKDMAWDPDGYRFHDAFHLTYAAMLGWSPLTRTFFDCSRVSSPQLREIEDSGRAKVIEEGIAAYMFEYARQMRFLDGVEHIDSSQLDTIRNLVSRLEVRTRTAAEWERAILRSFAIWRELRDHHGGTVHLNLLDRTIEFEAPR
jgi:NTP pyrophosphatase (non-canonical NTP hydrolase)